MAGAPISVALFGRQYRAQRQIGKARQWCTYPSTLTAESSLK
jgi:hypothetical protein